MDLKEKEVDGKVKFDFDSENGQQVCREVLKGIQKVFQCYNLKKRERSYREKFTKAYKILYAQNGG